MLEKSVARHNTLVYTAKFSSSWLLVGLNDQGLVDVRDHTTASDGSLDQSVKLFITADSELEMTRSYSLHLEVLAGVTGELQDLSGQVLEDSSSVDGGRGADAAVRANSALQKSVDSSNRELKTKKLQLGFYLTINL